MFLVKWRLLSIPINDFCNVIVPNSRFWEIFLVDRCGLLKDVPCENRLQSDPIATGCINSNSNPAAASEQKSLQWFFWVLCLV